MSSIAVDRLRSQQLTRSKLKSAHEVVAWLGAIQAQDYAGAKWSVGVRWPGSTETAIEQALLDKSIVRSWVMRGTLHFVATDDLRWLLALLAPRIIAGAARRYQELELDEQTLKRSNRVITKALRNGQPLTRTVLFERLEKAGISTQGQRGVYMLQRASLDGLMCQTIMQGKDPLFIPLDEALPHKQMNRNEALAELARRYFISRGPATLQDFVWWSGLLMTDARVGLEAVKTELVQETIGDQTYWRSRSKSIARAGDSTAYLLPGFDEYLLGYTDRSASLDEPRYKRLTPPNGMLPPTMVIDGRVVGTWKRTLKKDSVVIAPEPFAPLTPSQRQALSSAAERYGAFVGRAVIVEKRD